MELLYAFCDKSYIVQVMVLVKLFFKLVCYIAPPIVIIVSIVSFFKPMTTGDQEDLKASRILLIKRIIAGLVVMLLPTIISYIFNNFSNGNDVNFLACMESATQEKVEQLRAKEAAEEKAERKAQEKEDEETLRKAYEEEQKKNGARKQSFEEWKKERENTSNNESNSSSNLRGNEWANKLLSEAQTVTTYIKNNNFRYGDAPINPAMDSSAKIVSCDRCVAWFLYKMGYTNQPQSHGVVVSQFPTWCEQNGFKKITNVSELKAGDVVFVNPDANGLPAHVYLLGNPVGNGIWERYDCGSEARIRLSGQYSNYQSQPFKEGIGNFMYAYRAKEAQ